MPIEPSPTRWAFPDVTEAPSDDIVAVGADLAPGTLLAAYRAGLFPMPLDEDAGRRAVAWWSPDPRGILPLDGLRMSRSLRKSCTRFEIRIDTAFEEVIGACADPRRPHGWISAEMRDAYVRLHRLGWAHSVESWALEDGSLAGGLYGVAIGGLFAGESMFHRVTDASKAALVALVCLLGDFGATLLDVQWQTPHLASLGAVEVSRREYVRRLGQALERPLPEPFRAPPGERPGRRPVRPGGPPPAPR